MYNYSKYVELYAKSIDMFFFCFFFKLGLSSVNLSNTNIFQEQYFYNKKSKLHCHKSYKGNIFSLRKNLKSNTAQTPELTYS